MSVQEMEARWAELEAKTVKELRAMARELGIEGRWKKKSLVYLIHQIEVGAR